MGLIKFICNMNRLRFVLIGLSFIGIVSVFMPWVDAPYYNVHINGIENGGTAYACLSAFVLVILLCFVGETDGCLGIAKCGAWVGGTVTGLIGVLHYGDVAPVSLQFVGSGLWLMLAVSVGIVVTPLFKTLKCGV